jgi:transposase
MEQVFVGIDVSKDQLDVHVRPSGEAFAVTRDGKGLEELTDRLRALAPALVAVEATGGFEMIVAAARASERPSRRMEAGTVLVAIPHFRGYRLFETVARKRTRSSEDDVEFVAR